MTKDKAIDILLNVSWLSHSKINLQVIARRINKIVVMANDNYKGLGLITPHLNIYIILFLFRLAWV